MSSSSRILSQSQETEDFRWLRLGPKPIKLGEPKKSDSDSQIKIGKDRQAIIPILVKTTADRKSSIPDRASCVWEPLEVQSKLSKQITELQLLNYLKASEKQRFSEEQALGLLYWRRYNLKQATEDLSKYAVRRELVNFAKYNRDKHFFD